MLKGPLAAAELIYSVLPIDGAPRRTRDVLVDIIINQQWADASSAFDLAEAWLDRFINRLIYVLDEKRSSGGYLSFSFNSSGNDFIQGYCFCEPTDKSGVIEAKRNRAQTIRIFERIKKLSPAEFETLSGNILTLLKVEIPYVTRRSADQGVDFYGRVPLGDILKPKLLDLGAEKNMFVWLVGQSKHYPETKVSTSEIRELAGSVEFARAKIYAGKTDPLINLTLRPCDPIIFMFFTSGKFTRDSNDLLRRSGVLSFDGLQISQFLADHGVGISAGLFDDASFELWLKS